MASAGRASSAKRRLDEWLAREKPAVVDEVVRRRLLAGIAPVSEAVLRRLLRDCGYPLAPLVEGVRQESLDSLERTLCALAREYETGRRDEARRAVLTAKEHARWAARRKPSPERAETIQWMLEWLENPPVFESWVRLRRRAAEQAHSSAEDIAP
jgi:hypothetical protein